MISIFQVARFQIYLLPGQAHVPFLTRAESLNIPYLGEFAAIFTAVCWSLSALAFTSSSRLVGSQVVNRLRVLIGFLALLVLNWVVFGTPVPLKTGRREPCRVQRLRRGAVARRTRSVLPKHDQRYAPD